MYFSSPAKNLVLRCNDFDLVTPGIDVEVYCCLFVLKWCEIFVGYGILLFNTFVKSICNTTIANSHVAFVK